MEALSLESDSIAHRRALINDPDLAATTDTSAFQAEVALCGQFLEVWTQEQFAQVRLQVRWSLGS